MREIGIEYLRKDLASALEDMPVAITRRGKVVGYLVGDITNLTVAPNLTSETTLASSPTVLYHIPLKPRLPSSRKQTIKKLKAEVKAADKDEFNPLKECFHQRPFKAQTHHSERE